MYLKQYIGEDGDIILEAKDKRAISFGDCPEIRMRGYRLRPDYVAFVEVPDALFSEMYEGMWRYRDEFPKSILDPNKRAELRQLETHLRQLHDRLTDILENMVSAELNCPAVDDKLQN